MSKFISAAPSKTMIAILLGRGCSSSKMARLPRTRLELARKGIPAEVALAQSAVPTLTPIPFGNGSDSRHVKQNPETAFTAAPRFR